MPQGIDRVFIEKEDKEKYNKIQENSFFQGHTNSQLFLFTLCFGLQNGAERLPLKNKLGYFRLDSMKEEEEVLFKVLAVFETQSVEVLDDPKNIYNIAEEYANFGIKILFEELESTQFGTFHKVIEIKLNDMLQYP